MVARPCDSLFAHGSASAKTLRSLGVEHGGSVLKVEGVAVAVIHHVEPFFACLAITNDILQVATELKRVAL
jgi:hypothetical protein